MTFHERALLLHIALLIPGRFSLSKEEHVALAKLIAVVAKAQAEIEPRHEKDPWPLQDTVDSFEKLSELSDMRIFS